MAEKGGRTYVSKEELSLIESIKSEKQEILDIEQQELANIKALQDAYKNTGDESLKLTDAMKERLRVSEVENTLKTETSSLEKKLSKQAQSLNTKKKKDAEYAQAALAAIQKSLEDGDITTDQYKSQAAVIEQIASGQASSKDIQQAQADLGENMTEEMAAYLKEQEKAKKQSERGKQIAEETDKAFGGMGTTIKNFLTNPLTAVFALLTAFSAATDAIGKQFGAIGATDFRKELGAARKEFVGMGLEGDEALGVISTLSNEFGIGFEQAMAMADEVGNLAKSTGMATSEAANLMGVLITTQGLTEQEAMDLSKSTVALAKANKVAPDAVLKDLAGSAETFAKFSDGSADGLMRAAIQARKLGTDLNSIAGSAEKSLDFQSSLTAEITASQMLGRTVNMQKARELAMAGDMEGYAKEIAKQAGTAADFNKMNVYQRNALADALGVQLGTLSKIVNKEKEAVTLAGELAKADASNILPEESMSKIAETIANLKMMGLELVEEYGPQIEDLLSRMVEPLMSGAEALINWVTSISESEDGLGGLESIIAGVVGVLALMAASSLASAIAGIYTAFSFIPFGLGIPLAIAAVYGMYSMITSMTSGLETGTELGGIQSDGVVRTLHKGETVLNAKDTAMLATSLNAVRGGGGGGTTNTVNLERENREIKEEMKKLRDDMKSYFGFGGTATREIASGVTGGMRRLTS